MFLVVPLKAIKQSNVHKVITAIELVHRNVRAVPLAINANEIPVCKKLYSCIYCYCNIQVVLKIAAKPKNTRSAAVNAFSYRATIRASFFSSGSSAEITLWERRICVLVSTRVVKTLMGYGARIAIIFGRKQSKEQKKGHRLRWCPIFGANSSEEQKKVFHAEVKKGWSLFIGGWFTPKFFMGGWHSPSTRALVLGYILNISCICGRCLSKFSKVEGKTRCCGFVFTTHYWSLQSRKLNGVEISFYRFTRAF